MDPTPDAPNVTNAHDNHYQTEITRTPQSQITTTHSSSQLENNPTTPTDDSHEGSTLTFPTLNLDGSIDDLSAIACPPPTTPPAALTRKTKMPPSDMSESTSSLDEAEYDMLADAVSDVSNDERAETASITTTERGDGEMTPDESVLDFDEEQDNLTASETLHGTVDTLLAQQPTSNRDATQAEEQLLDSYLTDDLETPRQSAIRDRSSQQPQLRSTYYPSSGTFSSPNQSPGKSPIRVLFVSEPDVDDVEILRISKRLASCLSTTSTAAGQIDAVELPSPPDSPSETLQLLIVAGDLELLVARYIHTDDGQPSKLTKSTAPNLAIYYLSSGHACPISFDSAAQELAGLDVPNLTLAAPGIDVDALSPSIQARIHSSDMLLDNVEFYSAAKDDLRFELEYLLDGRLNNVNRLKPHQYHAQVMRKMANAVKKAVLDSREVISIFLAVLAGCFFVYTMLKPGFDPAVELAIRRAALSDALVDITNSTAVANTFNITHLLPIQPTAMNETYFQAQAPNHMVVSLPRKIKGRGFTSPSVWKMEDVRRNTLDHNITKLIDGVYHISIEPSQAHGMICAEVWLHNPIVMGQLCHNYGSKILQRMTYQNAGKELSKVVTKDVAVASQRVKTLKEKFELDVMAGASATKNMTTQLAVYVARDLQIIANTAVSVVTKISEESHGAVQRLNDQIRNDIQKGQAVVERGLLKLQDTAQKSLQKTSRFTKDLIPTRKGVGKSLSGARERAMTLKNKLQSLKSDTNSTSASKELSLRVKQFFNPTLRGKRAGSLKDIAKCLRAEDYRTCRRTQKKKAELVAKFEKQYAEAKEKSAKTGKKASGVAKVPEKEVRVLQQDDPAKHMRHGTRGVLPSAQSIRVPGKEKKKDGKKKQ